MRYLESREFVEKYQYMDEEDQRRIQRYVEKLESVRRMERRLESDKRSVIRAVYGPNYVEPKDGFQIICSFCGKPIDQVQKMIAGPGVYICNECVVVCAMRYWKRKE